MWCLQGSAGRDLCDRHLQPTRRDVLRVGGAGMLGLHLDHSFGSKPPRPWKPIAAVQGGAAPSG